MIEIRQTETFAAWLAGLRDGVAKAKIAVRIQRMAMGNPGDVKPVGGASARCGSRHGPGYRVYFVQRGRVLVVLLCGGDKSSQAKDIKAAKAMAQEVE